jgi:D-ribose pyranase
MKRTALLNAPLSAAIARLGHTDLLLVADGGLPIPAEPERIDLALVAGVPSMMQTLRAIFLELAVEAAIVAEEQAEFAPKFHAELRAFLEAEGVALRTMTHIAFKQEARRARAAVRTAELTPYTNILLQCGVVFGPHEDDPPRDRAVPVDQVKPA